MSRSCLLTLVATAGLLGACSPSDRVARGKPDGGGVGGSGGNGGGSGGNGGSGGQPAPPLIDTGRPFSGEHSDPSAPPDAKDAFGGPAGSDPALKLVYPLDGAMLGKNIGQMNIQWAAGTTSKIFRVRIKGDMGEAFLYAGAAACPMGKCQYMVPDTFWTMIGEANAGARFTITVDGVAAAGGAVSSTAANTNYFAPNEIEGAIYYWSTSLKGTMRVKLGDKTPEPFVVPGQNGVPGDCVACHSLTREGCKLMIRTSNGFFGIVDARDNTKVVQAQCGGSFFAWNPDGTRYLTVSGGSLSECDGVTGARIGPVNKSFVGAAGNDVANHPEWSPDGQWITMVRMPMGVRPGPDDLHDPGDIMLMPYNGGAFGMANVLVPSTADEVNHYPDFSADSKWIVFNTNKNAESKWSLPSSYDQPSARLRLVPVAGGPPIELANATFGSRNTASWPKFSPFVQRAGNLTFVVFSSRLPYGWVTNGTRPNLWVAAIDTGKSGDPSYSPFWLPFQVPTEGNHIGFWTKKIVVKGTVGGSMVDCE